MQSSIAPCQYQVRTKVEGRSYSCHYSACKGNKSSAVAEMAGQCCKRAFAFEWIPVFNACFLVISENVAANHVFLNNRFFGLHFRRKQYGSSFNHFGVIGPKAAEFGEITQNNGHARFKVTTFGTNRKRVCDSLCVHNTKHINVNPISRRFRDIAY